MVISFLVSSARLKHLHGHATSYWLWLGVPCRSRRRFLLFWTGLAKPASPTWMSVDWPDASLTIFAASFSFACYLRSLVSFSWPIDIVGRRKALDKSPASAHCLLNDAWDNSQGWICHFWCPIEQTHVRWAATGCVCVIYHLPWPLASWSSELRYKCDIYLIWKDPAICSY
jgi:hypothetical protein